MICHSSLQQVRAVTFDLDDTLYDNSGVIDRAEKWFRAYLESNRDLKSAGIAGCYDEFKSRTVAVNPEIIHDVTRFRRETLVSMFRYSGNSDLLAAYNADAVMKAFIAVRSTLVVPHQSFSLLRALSRKYLLGAITNGNVDAERIGLSSCFSFVLRANERLKSKPSPVIFTEAARLCDLPSHRILHVGDDICTDLSGSKLAGMKSCLLRTDINCNNLNLKPDVEICHLAELRILLDV